MYFWQKTKEHVYSLKHVKPGEQLCLFCRICNIPVVYVK